MPKRPQFSLKAILVIIAVLAVPMALFASENTAFFVLGYSASFLAGGGSLGYLVGGREFLMRGIGVGLFMAVLLSWLFASLLIP